MRFCNQCSHYSPGQPPYCPYCGRSYNVRLCPRGHANGRQVTFCSQCGSDVLSTPAPREDWGVELSRWLLIGAVTVALSAVAITVLLAVAVRIPWAAVFCVVLEVLILYWLLQWLLPAPVKRAGGAVGRSAGKVLKIAGKTISRRSDRQRNRRPS